LNPWFTVDLGDVFSVRMIAVLNQESNTASADKLGPSELRVGNSTNPDENQSCGVTVMDGGFYDCRLKGRYVTLRRTSTSASSYHFAEMSVWAEQNICPRGTATLSSTYTDTKGPRLAEYAQTPVPVI